MDYEFEMGILYYVLDAADYEFLLEELGNSYAGFTSDFHLYTDPTTHVQYYFANPDDIIDEEWAALLDAGFPAEAFLRAKFISSTQASIGQW